MTQDRGFEELLGKAFQGGGESPLAPGEVCPEFENLAAYVEGRLEGEDLVSTEAHLASCQECRLTLAGVRAAEETPLDKVPGAWINRAKQAGPQPVAKPAPQPRVEVKRSWFSLSRLIPAGVGALVGAAVVMIVVWNQPSIRQAPLQTTQPAPQTVAKAKKAPPQAFSGQADMASHTKGNRAELLENALVSAWSQLKSLGETASEAVRNDPQLAARIAHLESALLDLADRKAASARMASAEAPPQQAMRLAPAPAAQPPEGELELAGVEADGDYDLSAIHGRIENLNERIKQCYQSASRAGAPQGNSLRIGLVIGADGHLTPPAKPQPGAHGNLQGCLLGLLGETPLPPPPGGSPVRVSILFRLAPEKTTKQ